MGTLVLVLLFNAALIVFVLYLVGRRINIADALSRADGRSIVIGENHADRDGLRLVLDLMHKAHEAGYRKLGVEICTESKEECSGLLEELEHLHKVKGDELLEYDERSSLNVVPGLGAPRMNRYWQMQLALRLGWDIVPIDPHHWNWMSGTEEGYCLSREPAMAENIRQKGPMLAVVGYGHLSGLQGLLRTDAFYVVACLVDTGRGQEKFWKKRFRFAAAAPQLMR